MPPPPRLFVITATEADRAIVFRHGPTAWFHLLMWDLARDELTSGAWFRGKLAATKCDLSPDGKLLLYFAHQGRKVGTSFSDSWTALSRAPWLTALALWPHGTTYGGGGRFTGNRAVTLRHSTTQSHSKFPAVGLEVTAGNAPLHRSLDVVEDAEWSGTDRRGDVLFAREGALFRCGKRGKDRLIADLRELRPEPLASPPWAREPLLRVPTQRRRRDSNPR